MKSFITFFVALTVITITSYSQHVIPSDEVVNHVNVRELNSAGSVVIDSLFPGESLEYIESVAYWHKVRCEGGQDGYVSKRWTLLDDGFSIDQGKDELVIGTWNIKNFASCSRDTLHYSGIADIFEQYDVIAIQEVSANVCTKHMDSIVDELERRGLKYFYVFSEKTGYWNNPNTDKGNYRERLGFFWDIDRVDLLHPDEPYFFISEPCENNEVFRQVPIVCDFKVRGSNGFDFRAVSVHAAFNDKIPYVRAEEFRFLDKWMKTQINNDDIVEKDVFIMGDFNSNPPGQKDHHYFDTIIGNNNQYRVLINEPLMAGELSITTTLHFPTASKPGDSTQPVYDQILMSNQSNFTIPDTLRWSSGWIDVIQFDQKDKWQQAGKHATIKSMSDHRPIWIKLPYNTEDRD